MSRLHHRLGRISVLGFAVLAASCAGSATEGGSGGSGVGTGGAPNGTGGRSATGGSAPSGSGGSGTGGEIATGGRSGGATGGTAGTGAGGRAATGSGGAAGGGGGGAAGAKGTGGAVINPTACSTGTAQSADVTVSLSSLQQKITGFGVSSAWAGNYNNASDADYLWSTTKGAGLTLLRVRYGDGLAIAQSAAKNGATVWMTPWGTGANGSTGGPDTTTQNNPNGCKTGNMPVLTNPTDFASKLVAWVQNAKTQGIPIYAVSAGNEPDSCGINQTTSYSAAQMAAWLDVLGPAMAGIGVKVMAPETQNACGFTSYYTAIKNDSAAWNAVDIFASHEYGCGTLPSEPAIAAAGKEYWETEVDTGTAKSDPSGDGIASALLMAQTMHNDLTKANLNAWLLWWLYESGNSGGCLYDTGSKVWTKRLWVMGNFSRFVRPGYMRVSTSGTAPSGVLVTAYKNPTDGTVVVVAINNNTAATPLSLYVSGAVPCSITPWVTSATDNLASQTPITVTNARFSATLAAQSVTTFVGTP
ncbi:MAG: glycoside hydrolase family 30 beta sandwich domain-containing protein [Pseudomonadota bacterium]